MCLSHFLKLQINNLRRVQKIALIRERAEQVRNRVLLVIILLLSNKCLICLVLHH